MTTRTITAAVLRPGKTASSFERLTAAAPQADEVLVRLVATGICHTDLTCRDGILAMQRPIVLGHEGAGVVEQVGEAVATLAVGDPVVLSFVSCGACPSCVDHHPAYCAQFGPGNLSGRRMDGSTWLHDEHGEVAAHFFGQSSFATHSVVRASSAVKIRADAPLEFLGPLGCGVQTGAGAVFNVLKPPPDSSLAIFGAGGVGLSAVMAAAVAGCAPIIVVEPHPARRALALELGATHAIDTDAGRVVEEIVAITRRGCQYAIDTSGIPAVIAQALDALASRGELALISANALDATLPTPLMAIMLNGRVVRGVSMGDGDPQAFIPYLVDLFMDGRFPLDRLASFYDFANIDEALDDQAHGRAIKPILRMSPVEEAFAR